jgi:hypothetical protein
MLVVTNELAGRTEAEAVGEVVGELGGGPMWNLSPAIRSPTWTRWIGGPAVPSLSSAVTVRCTRC